MSVVQGTSVSVPGLYSLEVSDVGLQVARDEGRTSIAQAALVDLLPGGFELVIPTEQSETACFFCSAGSTTPNIGIYTIPPAYGEAMYDRSVLARSVARTINVVKP